jgi:hypothetical protein
VKKLLIKLLIIYKFEKMSAVERFDNFLITIVSETGGIEGLLNSMFSFLYRRTDFFYEMVPGDKMGFLPGEAEKMVGAIDM